MATVYVLEKRSKYRSESKHVVGVFDTANLARESVDQQIGTEYTDYSAKTAKWQHGGSVKRFTDDDVSFEFTITKFKVASSMPSRTPSAA